MTYRPTKIDIITFAWQSGGLEALIEFKINGHLRTMKVPRQDMTKYFITECDKYGINQSNVEEMMEGVDPKYSLQNEFLIKYLISFFKV